MRNLLLLILLLSMLPFAARSEGIDKTYSKSSENKSWTQRFAELVGYDSGFSKSYALVVGISNFTGYKNLPTTQDPLRVRDYLLASGFDEVHVLTEEKVTLGRLRTLMLDDFPTKVDKNDRFLLYWSGHGVERENTKGGQTGYLPLADSIKGRFSSMASMDDISRWDGFLQARHVLYLIDACFSGLAGIVSKSSQAELVIEQMLKPARFLLTAGSAEEETIASDQWGGSLFTHALLSGLSGAADTSSRDFPSDGVISLFELISHIKKRVAVERDNRWPKPITPQLRDLRGSNGEFFFLTSSFDERLHSDTNSTPIIPKSGLEILPPESKNKKIMLEETEPVWRQEFYEFVDNPFDLCGYKEFTASVFANSTTELTIRSTDRSIPSQPFRGLEKRVELNQMVELFPGCVVLMNYLKTQGTPRIRVLVKEENK